MLGEMEKYDFSTHGMLDYCEETFDAQKPSLQTFETFPCEHCGFFRRKSILSAHLFFSRGLVIFKILS